MSDDVLAVAKTDEETVPAPQQSKGDDTTHGFIQEDEIHKGAVKMTVPISTTSDDPLPNSQPPPATAECTVLANQVPLASAPPSLDAPSVSRNIGNLDGIIKAACNRPSVEENNPITIDIAGCHTKASEEMENCVIGSPQSLAASSDNQKKQHSPSTPDNSSALLSCLGEGSAPRGDRFHDSSGSSSSQLVISATLSPSLQLPQSATGSKNGASRSVSPARSQRSQQSSSQKGNSKYARRGSSASNTSTASDVSSRAWAKIQDKASSFKKNDLVTAQSRSGYRRRAGSFTVHASDVAPTAQAEVMPELSEIHETVQAERKRLAKNIASRSYGNDRKESCGEKKLMGIVPQNSDSFSNTSENDRLRQRYLGFILPIKWALTGLSAITIALQAGFIILGSHELVIWKLALVEVLCDSGVGGQVLAYLFFLSVAFGLSFMAAILVTYVAPHAGGGGIPEVMAHLNGVEMPQAFTFKTWLCRSVGLIAVTSAGVFAGPEGPFVHIGSLVAVGILRGPKLKGRLLWTPCLQGHQNRCEYIAQGAAMGVAAAFGAPIGGVLFSLEEAATYWNKSLTWRTFFGCSVAAVIAKLTKSGFSELSMTGFIEFPDADVGFEPWELSMFLILGVGTGLFQGGFCYAVGKLGRWRRIRYSLGNPTKDSKRARVAEVLGIVLLTITVCFWLPVIVGCRPLHPDAIEADRRMASSSGPPDFSGGICTKNEYSDIAYILLQPKEEAVKALFSRSLSGGAQFDILSLLVCFIIVYFLTLITFGSAIPCGLFIPNILSGACLGRAMGEVLLAWDLQIHPGVYALMGSAGMLAGFSRMTIALTMIMLEITNNMKMLIPLLVTIMASKLVADFIAVGVNHQVLNINPNVHLLEDGLGDDHLLVLEDLTAHDLCISEVVVLHEHEPIGQIMCLLMSTSFEGYPVVGSRNKLLGFVTRVNLVNAVACYNPQGGTLMDILKLSGTPPEITPWSMPLGRAYHHFRSSGLQRLCVVDEKHELIGILTRTDFARLCKHGREGVEEIRMLINRKHAKIAAGMLCRTDPKAPHSDTDSEISKTPSSARSQDDQESVGTHGTHGTRGGFGSEECTSSDRQRKAMSPLSNSSTLVTAKSTKTGSSEKVPTQVGSTIAMNTSDDKTQEQMIPGRLAPALQQETLLAQAPT